MIVLLASKTSGPVTALDLWSIAEDTPPQDTAFGGTYDLILESYKYTDTGFLAAVSRRLNTGDRYDAVITPNSTISMVCATESEKSWIEHDIKTSITVFLSQEAPSVESDATSIDDDRKTHGLIMTVMWTCAIPLGIIFARYFKWWGFWYWILHVIFTLPTIGLTLWSASQRYKDEKFTVPITDSNERYHSLLGLTILSLVIGQGVLGILSIVVKIYWKNIYKIGYVRRAHQVLGWSLLMCALINNFYGWKLYGNKENRDIYLRFMYATIGLIVFLELRHKIGSFLGCFKRPKRETTHLEILKEIKKHPKDYVFFEEFALDISRFKFTHPGGYFVIRDTIGEDIAKYMIGCSAYRHLNPYTHPTKALEFVKYLAIATIPYPLNYLTNKNNKYQDKMIWKFKDKIKVAENTYLITFVSDDFELSNNWRIASWLGKHFKITMPHFFLEKSVSRYYSSFFVNLDQWKSEISNEEYQISANNGLKFIYKHYPLSKMGTYLSNLTQDDQVTLKGPLGPGLCIDSLSGNFLAISGGTGVIPFLDLVYYVWNNRNNPHQFKLTLYVSFRARKDVFIEDLLTATQNSVSENVFRLIIVISGEKNSNEIKDIMKDLGKESPKKAWVCGPSGFNRFVLDNLLESGLARKKIIIM